MIRQIHLTVGALALFAVAFGAVLVGSAGDSYAAANLLANGYFDANVTNWAAQADASVTHDPAEDFHTNPSSGSAYVVRTSGGAGDAIVLSECVDITGTGDGTYRITGQVKRDPANWSGQQTVPTGDDPQVELIVTKFTDNGCSAGAAPIGLGSILLGNDNWIHASNDGLPGNVIVAGGELSLQVSMVIHAQANGDSAWFDIIGLTFTNDLDTPTPTNTPIATDTPAATNTPLPTNTPAATNTPVATNTPLPTDTPIATNTAAPTETAVSATNTSVPENTPETLEVGAPPAAAADNAGAAGAGGESPEGGAGAGEEEPEAGEVPESGTGPGSYSQERSHVADMVALGSFTLAIIMLGAGFALRKKYEEV